MPAIILKTSVKCSDEQKNLLAQGLSKICATELNKPEMYVMSIVQDNIKIFFGGQAKDTAMLEVKSIGGLNNKVNVTLSQAICKFLSQNINLDSSNIYINFHDITPENWGWNNGSVANK